MQADATNFFKFLREPKQLTIPIYQRKYSWTLKECDQLWNDIVETGTNNNISSHFLGSFVYIQRGLYQASSLPQVLVIDGQQRLTTISLLLYILGDSIENSIKVNGEEITKRKIDNYYLINYEESNELRYKLILNKTDKDTYINLIEGRELPRNSSDRIIENYEFFKDKINKTGIDLSTIYKGISKLIVVDISLDRQKDNPQLIFESLNSTGLELTQADLIRNFILMGLEAQLQQDLYNNYWSKMENSFGQTAYIQRFDRFIRDYLTLKRSQIPNVDEVYQDFKRHADENIFPNIENLLKDVYKYSKYYVSMALEKEEDKELREQFENINKLKVDVAYPLLLELYDDYKEETITKNEFIEILKLIESYVFRRAICGIPTNSLNKTFATLNKEIDKGKYLESLKSALINKDSYRRFPSDFEFMDEFIKKDIYNFRPRNYLLSKFENHDRPKEKVKIDEYTIEHVMPQNKNLSKEWQNELGDNWKTIQERYLHTIGNLTLTGYNPELSDRPLKEKRDIKGGFRDSPIRLNNYLAKLEHWNEEEIINRAKILVREATKIWPYPELTEEIIKEYEEKISSSEVEQEYRLEDHEYLKGENLNLFNILRKNILNLDSSVKEQVRKLYIAYRSATNFVYVIPQKNNLKLYLNMNYNDIDDPTGICRNIENIERWGDGDIEINFESNDQIDDIMYLVLQSLDRNMDNGS